MTNMISEEEHVARDLMKRMKLLEAAVCRPPSMLQAMALRVATFVPVLGVILLTQAFEPEAVRHQWVFVAGLIMLALTVLTGGVTRRRLDALVGFLQENGQLEVRTPARSEKCV